MTEVTRALYRNVPPSRVYRSAMAIAKSHEPPATKPVLFRVRNASTITSTSADMSSLPTMSLQRFAQEIVFIAGHVGGDGQVLPSQDDGQPSDR